MADSRLTRIGVFYDGNYFFHVSNYYAFNHQRKARIDVSGLHNYIRRKVAENERSDEKYCQIVDAHYFRGRLRAQDADERDLLLKERAFDDILSREGVTTHYLPLGPFGEKGIDVWLALEAYELSIYKRFDVVVLIAGDGDFVPLVRKLNTIGTRMMLLAWDFKFTNANNVEHETKTAQTLIEEVTYPVLMHQVIDDRSLRNDPIINGLFVRKPEFTVRTAPPPAPTATQQASNTQQASSTQQSSSTQQTSSNSTTIATADTTTPRKGYIHGLKEGYGFIAPEDDRQSKPLFFFHADILNAEFNDLRDHDKVEYYLSLNERGPCAVKIRLLVGDEED
ncbi:MAG: NYN domain-containing protein [Pseudomonadales bacterium]|nr:NYN domain-containing protein [Pseudomonadales bacterium]